MNILKLKRGDRVKVYLSRSGHEYAKGTVVEVLAHANCVSVLVDPTNPVEEGKAKLFAPKDIVKLKRVKRKHRGPKQKTWTLRGTSVRSVSTVVYGPGLKPGQEIVVCEVKQKKATK